MNNLKKLLLPALLTTLGASESQAFCGFYVAKAGASLYNEKSEVIMVRDGQRTVITMSNDFKGAATDFAMVVPVPHVLKEQDIRVVDRGLFDRFDAYSSPRLVEYFDPAPCGYREVTVAKSTLRSIKNVPMSNLEDKSEVDYGVHIEASYTVGEYDILILSAEESNGLKTWLIKNGYKIPESANEVLQPYINSGMKFFVVKVNLEAAAQTGYQYLRPIQISMNTDKFMLPIRLGMANSKGEQDLIIYAITRSGAVETTNYRNLRMVTGRTVPTFIKTHFDRFYTDLFARQHANEGRNAVFTEYAWDVTPNWGIKCDPCVGNPPQYNDLISAGVNWLDMNNPQGGNGAFFTRMHVRYGRAQFPQDLMFTTTSNRESYQARYVINWPAGGDMSCPEARKYLSGLPNRRRMELMELGALTGWDISLYKQYEQDGMDPGIREGEQKGMLPIRFDNRQDPPAGGQGPLWFLFAGILATALLLVLPTMRRQRIHS
ncbi:MAG: DUF2330 domain-containing protein [Bacteroidetes bacterium]|nr:DUF2330 domain-containing protein [Bacteroidota bacterium]